MTTTQALPRLAAAAQQLADDPAWRTIRFDGEGSDRKSEKINEARGDVIRCAAKLQKLVEGEGA